MSTSTQLKAWDKTHTPLQGRFLGVFSSDTIPPPQDIAKAAPCCLIVNYDPHKMPGSHWMACLISHEVAWFDSYGLQADDPDLILGHKTRFRGWLGAVCHHLGLGGWTYNTADLQGWTAKTCGQWNLWFFNTGTPRGGLSSAQTWTPMTAESKNW